MLHPNLPVYLREVRFGTEKKDGETRKIVQCALVVAPFTSEMAEELGAGIREHVFRRTDAQPIENLAEVKFKINVPLQQLRVKLAVDQTRDMVLIENVNVDSELKVRRDKETPTFEATIWIDFPYPTAETLLLLANQQNEQIVVSFYDSQRNMLDDEQAEPETPRLGRKRKEKAGAAETESAPAEAAPTVN